MNYIFTPTEHTRICSNHFDDNDFIKTDQLRHLKPDAIPTKLMGVRRSLLSGNLLYSYLYLFIYLYYIY